MYDQTIDWDNSPTLLADVFNTEMDYDAMNRPIEITQPDDSVVAYTYNKAGLLETVNAKIRGIATYTEFVTDIDYNEKGQRTDVYYRNGSKTSYTYDDESFRLTNLKTTRNSGNDTLQDIDYTYDAVGNITEVEDKAQQTFYYSNSVIAPKGKYWYDALYRLTKATGRELSSLAMPTHTDFVNNLAVPNTASNAMQNYTQEFSYDELGNISQMKSSVGTNWTRDYYYETANNRLKNHDNQSVVYSYDEHGNCIEMPHLPQLDWDYKDELKEVTLNAGGDKAYYVYDSTGERVRKVIDKGNIVEERFYIGGYEVYRKAISGVPNYERETLKITEGRNTIAQLETKIRENGSIISTPTTNQRFQYSNHLGSACLELDNSASIISYEEYHPFGTTSYRSGSSQTEVSQKRYKYVGKERDEETGLYYYGARYYAGWIAIFVSVDPLQFEYPQYTPYQYAGNKPVTYIDLDGLEEYKIKNELDKEREAFSELGKAFVSTLNSISNLFKSDNNIDSQNIREDIHPVNNYNFEITGNNPKYPKGTYAKAKLDIKAGQHSRFKFKAIGGGSGSDVGFSTELLSFELVANFEEAYLNIQYANSDPQFKISKEVGVPGVPFANIGAEGWVSIPLNPLKDGSSNYGLKIKEAGFEFNFQSDKDPSASFTVVAIAATVPGGALGKISAEFSLSIENIEFGNMQIDDLHTSNNQMKAATQRRIFEIEQRKLDKQRKMENELNKLITYE